MKIDIGVCSYGKNAAQLGRTLKAIADHTVSEFRCLVIHNPSDGDGETRETICKMVAWDGRFVAVWMPHNVGYVGAVNELARTARTEYFAYCDNDAVVESAGWDQRFISVLQEHPEVGQIFPGAGHFGFDNGSYHECLWNAGYFWMLRTSAVAKVKARDDRYGTCDGSPGLMDDSLGHHEEVDLMLRLRLTGYRIACCPDVIVKHLETATNANPADHQPGGRIHDGVVRWMNKTNRYFLGNSVEYSMTAYDPRALRYTDWHPDALYLERLTLHYFPQWNANPRTVEVPGVGTMDVVEVLKPRGPYKGRAI